MSNLFARIILALYLLKFFIPVVFDNDWIKWFTCESCYIMGNPFLISTTIYFGEIIAPLFSFYIRYEERNQILYILDFMDQIKNHSPDLKLSPRNQKKFCLKINLMIDYLTKCVFTLLVIFITITFISLHYCLCNELYSNH